MEGGMTSSDPPSAAEAYWDNGLSCPELTTAEVIMVEPLGRPTRPKAPVLFTNPPKPVLDLVHLSLASHNAAKDSPDGSTLSVSLQFGKGFAELEGVFKWSVINGLTLNVGKCTVLHTTPRLLLEAISESGVKSCSVWREFDSL
ncbi:hypothetical protein J6590_100637 [Homalodisca vitripennis]|nr:hypothetical protein J6590_100637 [Homalodisca vitripennis]